jgi:hypothetical protein
MTEPISDPDSRARNGISAVAGADAHLAFGWWALFLFLVLGIVLEALHAFKIGYYLDVSNETRRLMWRLAHAHGTLIALVHIAFALSLPSLAGEGSQEDAESRSEGGDPPALTLPPALSLASRCLYGCAVLLPLGFFLGGIFVYGGDPGLAIVLAPIGALLGGLAVLLIARATRRGQR